MLQMRVVHHQLVEPNEAPSMPVVHHEDVPRTPGRVRSSGRAVVRPANFMNILMLLFVWNTHRFIDSLDNLSTASGPAWCRRCRPPGKAVSGHTSTMCLVVWWLSPQGQAGDAIKPHRWRDSAHLAWPHLRRFSVTNWRLGRVNTG